MFGSLCHNIFRESPQKGFAEEHLIVHVIDNGRRSETRTKHRHGNDEVDTIREGDAGQAARFTCDGIG